MKEKQMQLLRDLIAEVVNKNAPTDILESIILYSRDVIDMYKEDSND